MLLLEKSGLSLDTFFSIEDDPGLDGGGQDLERVIDQINTEDSVWFYLPEDPDGVRVTTEFLVCTIDELNSELTRRTSQYLFTPSRYLVRIQAVDDFHAYILPDLHASPRDSVPVGAYERDLAAFERLESIPIGDDTKDTSRASARRDPPLNVYAATSGSYRPIRHFQLLHKWNGTTIRFSLISGFSQLALDSVFTSNWTKDYPPYFHEELAIEVEWVDGPLTLEEAHAASNAYQYSLETSLGLKLKSTERTPVAELLDFEEELLNSREGRVDGLTRGRIRPLLDGPGLDELHSLYLRATATTDIEVQHLFFTKVIEYVSQTVILQDRDDAVRRLLNTEKALQPDAAYIDALVKQVVSHDRRTRDDLGALKVTIVTCCDALLLAPYAPPSLSLASITTDSTPQERQRALERLAETIHSTRNEIAHAKANYERTGKECPVQDRGVLIDCMRQIAHAVINWYSNQPADFRVHTSGNGRANTRR